MIIMIFENIRLFQSIVKGLYVLKNILVIKSEDTHVFTCIKTEVILLVHHSRALKTH